MAFTVTTQLLATRRDKLRQVQSLVSQLLQLNETARQTSAQLLAQGVAAGEVANTLDKILASGGPPHQVADTDPVAFVGDTVSDRIISIMCTITDGIGWEHTV